MPTLQELLSSLGVASNAQGQPNMSVPPGTTPPAPSPDYEQFVKNLSNAPQQGPDLSKLSPEDQDLVKKAQASLAQKNAPPTPAKPAAPDSSDEDDNDEGSSPSETPSAQISVSTPKGQMNFTGARPGSSEQELATAQKQRDTNVLGSKLEKLGTAIGSGIAKVAPDYSFANDDLKRANQPVEDLAAQRAQQANDPNSAYSQGMRDYFQQKLGINAQGASATDLANIAPMAVKQYESDQQRAAQKANLGYKYEELKEIAALRGSANSDKAKTADDAKTNKDFMQLANKLTSETAGSRTAFGKAANVIRSADSVEALINQMGDPNNIDKRQMQEIARNLDAMLTAGAATVSGANKLVPASAAGDLSTLQEYIQGIPKGAQQGEFVKRTLETIRRERGVAEGQIQKAQGKVLSGYSHLKEKDADRYNEMMKTFGLKSTIEAPRPPSAPQGSSIKGTVSKSVLSDYATKHSISEDDAADFLKKSGATVEGY